jgi:flagellar motor protein MotB
MSSKLFGLIGLVCAAAASVGCQGTWVTKQQYDTDMQQQREYREALERDNALLRPKAEAYDKIKGQADLFSDANRTYAELADALKKALSGMGVSEKEIEIDEKTGKVSFATDVLFELGSWTLTARGKDILAKFAAAQRGHGFRIVGHTDKKPIVRPATKQALDTDTNKELSVKRAVAVMGALLAHGVREAQIDSVVGMGSAQPRENDSKSRRVEIYLVETSGPPAPVRTSFNK